MPREHPSKKGREVKGGRRRDEETHEEELGAFRVALSDVVEDGGACLDLEREQHLGQAKDEHGHREEKAQNDRRLLHRHTGQQNGNEERRRVRIAAKKWRTMVKRSLRSRLDEDEDLTKT